MLYRDQEKFATFVLRLIDLLVVSVAFFLAIILRARIDAPGFEPFNLDFAGYLDKFLLVLIIWSVALSLNRIYQSHRGQTLSQVSWKIVKASALGLLMIGAVLFFFQEFLVHRTLIFIFVGLAALLLILEKALLFTIVRRFRKRGRFRKYALILGTGDEALRLAARLREQGEVGIEVVGLVSMQSPPPAESIGGIPVLGAAGDLRGILRQHVIDEVFITASLDDWSLIQAAIFECQEVGVLTRLLVRNLAAHKSTISLDEFLGTPFVSFSMTPLNVFALNAKAILDFSAASLLVIVLFPLLLLIACGIKLDSKGPVFFRQNRAGQNGRTFEMFKFRSMDIDAEQRLDEVASLNIMAGPVFKAADDPRVTRLGRFLRKTSMDELPQLLNVITGEMSLVGPRPLPNYEAEQLRGSDRRRLSMKPGITGLWQVSGRNELDFKRWVDLDLAYIDRWSLMLDLKILFKTFPALLRQTGAY